MGKSISLDGVDQSAQRTLASGAPVLGNFGTADFAHWIWFKSLATSTINQDMCGLYRVNSGQNSIVYNIVILPSDDGSNPNKVRYQINTVASGNKLIFSDSAFAGDALWHLAMIIGKSATVYAFLDGGLQATSQSHAYNFNTGGLHFYTQGISRFNSLSQNFFNGNLTNGGLVTGTISPSPASFATTIYNKGDPLAMSAISSIVAGWPFDNVVSFPTLPDTIGAKDLTATNMVAGDIVDDFPVGPAVDGLPSRYIKRYATMFRDHRV